MLLTKSVPFQPSSTSSHDEGLHFIVFELLANRQIQKLVLSWRKNRIHNLGHFCNRGHHANVQPPPKKKEKKKNNNNNNKLDMLKMLMRKNRDISLVKQEGSSGHIQR